MTTINPIPEHTGDDNEPHIFTTARWDPELIHSDLNTAASGNQPCPFYMFEHHYNRLQVPQWQDQSYIKPSSQTKPDQISNLLQALLGSVSEWQKRHPDSNPESLRIKMRSYSTGRKSIEFFPVPRIPLTTLFPSTLDLSQHSEPVTWTVVLDTQPTPATDETRFKTSERECYNRARVAAGITTPATPKEVLLYTADGKILDGSITTPYFFRGDEWVTPSAQCGGQLGTTRRWSLEKGLAVEGIVSTDDLVDGEVLWLSNGVRGFFRARFVAQTG